MKCPECVEEGKKSTIHCLGGSRTLMGWTQYYDEDGNYHNHDPNHPSMGYRCSNGHTWHVTRKNSCPTCGEDW